MEVGGGAFLENGKLKRGHDGHKQRRSDNRFETESFPNLLLSKGVKTQQ